MTTIARFADLHCHPHMRSYNWLHKHRTPEERSKYNPWWIVLPKKKPEEEGKRAAAYSQCDLAKIVNGNLQLAFLSLYPLERGWVTGRRDATQEVAKNLKKIFGENRFNESISVFMNKVLRIIGNDKKGELAIRDILQAIFMKIPLRRINYVQSNKYDYFKELLEEKKFLDKRNNKETSTELFIPFYKKLFVNKKKILAREGDNLSATGEFVLTINGKDVENVINSKKNAFVLTIEGANVFNTHEEFESIQNKIKVVKKWTEPIFFITFTHHFNNFLAGHAHSIPDAGNLLLDQSEGLNSGFTPKGLKVLRYLLAINEEGLYKPDEFGRRILIDVKHLNAKSRNEYYRNFVLPSLKSDNPIPVIASHVAYTGKIVLQQLIDRMEDEEDGDFTERNGHKFNNWNINLCDEDVINIYKSKGLIGINLDQRVLGVSKEDITKEDTHANYVWQNIKGMMLAVINSNDPDLTVKNEITQTFCLGTDFDGFIDPLNKYPTVMNFEQLGLDLIEVIENDPDKSKLLFDLDVETFVKKICFDNAYDFVVKNFK
ncbi:MAG: hypothetical protein HQ522_11510 [Bacteroidetes bacterium]|nr:hypothetical protein [Bacteroidota bacterium]